MTPEGRFRPPARGQDTIEKLSISVADDLERNEIYRLRHEVYARELGQHAVNAAGCVRDGLDDLNTYIVAKNGNAIAGFISITSPGKGYYSIDKYFSRI